MKKKFLCIILSICMIIPAFSGMSAYATGVEKIETTSNDLVEPMSQVPAENGYEKIHFYFDTAEHAELESSAELASATASVKTDYAATLGVAQRRGTDSNVDENVYITVQFVSDYMEDETYKTLKAARENAKTADQRDEAKTNMNRYSKQYHADLVAENLPTLSAIPYTDFHAIDYSSFVTLTVPAASLNASVLEEVADQDNILHISLNGGLEAQDDDLEDASYASNSSEDMTQWENVLRAVCANDIVSGGLYTGYGINIGIYESKGICDVSHSNLVGKSIICENSADPITDHATRVTSIVAMMAPQANIFVKMVDGSTDDVLGLQWFIDNNCDVINCSFGYYDNPKNGNLYSCGIRQYRYDIDAVYDEQIRANEITVVKSAGNTNTDNTSPKYNPYADIVSPGYAYNVITVGGVEYSNNLQGWAYTSGACYDNGIYNQLKPNVVAPYSVEIEGFGVRSGTSYSSPIVAACVCLYYQYYFSMVSSSIPVSLARSVVMASANKTANYQAYANNYSADSKVGAGIIDLKKMLTVGDISFAVLTEQQLVQNGYYEISFVMKPGAEFTASLTWNLDATTAAADGSGGSITTSNYYLYLINSNNVIIARSYYVGSADYIRYTVSSNASEEMYKIRISRSESVDDSVQLSVAFTRKVD